MLPWLQDMRGFGSDCENVPSNSLPGHDADAVEAGQVSGKRRRPAKKQVEKQLRMSNLNKRYSRRKSLKGAAAASSSIRRLKGWCSSRPAVRHPGHVDGCGPPQGALGAWHGLVNCCSVVCRADVGLAEKNGRRYSTRQKMAPLRWYMHEKKEYERTHTSALPQQLLWL